MRSLVLGTALVTAVSVATLTPAVFAATPQSTYSISVVAGNGDSANKPVNGPSSTSPMSPTGLARDAAGDMFFVSHWTYVVKVTPSGALSVIAGNGTSGTAVGGPALSSPMTPQDVAVDAAGNVFVADSDGYVEKLTPSADGSTYTLAVIASGDNFQPTNLALDAAGDPFVSGNGIVYKFTPDVGGVTYTGKAIAGSNNRIGGPTVVPPPTDGGPALDVSMAPYGLSVDAAGNVFLADGNARIDELKPVGDGTYTINFIAGNGDYSYSDPPTPGPAMNSSLQSAEGSVAVDTSGNLFVSDGRGYLDKLVPVGDGTYTLSVVAGDGQLTNAPTTGPATSSPIAPRGLAPTSDGDIYVANNFGYLEKLAPNFTVTGSSSVTGTPSVGDVLTAHPASVSPAATTAYRWLRNGAAIYGATGASYRLAAADEHTAISVRITYTEPGYQTLTQRAYESSKIAAGTFRVVKAGYLTGYSIVGHWLTTHRAALAPTPSHISYQWLRNGRAISGATSSVYKLGWADYRQLISVRISYSAPGYTTYVRALADGHRII